MEAHVFDLESPQNQTKLHAVEQLRDVADGIGVPMTAGVGTTPSRLSHSARNPR